MSNTIGVFSDVGIGSVWQKYRHKLYFNYRLAQYYYVIFISNQISSGIENASKTKLTLFFL